MGWRPKLLSLFSGWGNRRRTVFQGPKWEEERRLLLERSNPLEVSLISSYSPILCCKFLPWFSIYNVVNFRSITGFRNINFLFSSSSGLLLWSETCIWFKAYKVFKVQDVPPCLVLPYFSSCGGGQQYEQYAHKALGICLLSFSSFYDLMNCI